MLGETSENNADVKSAEDIRLTDDIKEDGECSEAVVEECANKYLIYGVNDTPPIHVTLVCALQQGLLSLSGQLITSLLVAEAVCASNNEIFKARLLSSTLLMSGITTVAMILFGIRLPLFQGATSEYVVPLLLVASVDETFCPTLATRPGHSDSGNMTRTNGVEDIPDDIIISNIQALQGSLLVAGVVHTMLGFTGLVGVLLKFVGPLTIVPTLVLMFVFFVKPVVKFAEVSWGISLSTIFLAVILFLYLGNHNMPVPVWTPSGGFHVIRYPLHQVFAILISIIVNWVICLILTKFDVIENDPNGKSFNARTDARSDIISDNPWFAFPYPGQYGSVGFSGPAFLACIIATFISVIDSIGDYYACARVCCVPAPPRHAVNRGILIEGVCSFISGSVGCGHATSTYGGNIGAIGVSRVASRRVFLFTGLLYILFGVFGKFSAVFITIPYPVLGGAMIVNFGIFVGVVLSNLEVTNMSSPRNMAILGLSIFIGISIPTWAQATEAPVNTGHAQFDSIMKMLLGNPNLTGTIIACFLDNTVPGSNDERGISAWQVSDDDVASGHDKTKFNEGYEVYNPLLPRRLLSSKIMKFIPFLPYEANKEVDTNVYSI
ncbi:solute carrier family 23 member 1-like [Ruditapes philippinarum]|uniref:solute carrier family 23 member 1-like n=1 Tax=Ruditapes philippinarum TaxID=129788 RepID=UPI00295C3296|nr:solute carrier family 23 member 1-like [Ruditapes philippinarum]